MEKFVKKLFNKNILNTAMDRFDFEKMKSRNLNGFQNFVFECHRNGEYFILRITHNSHRNFNQIKAEIEWIFYLFSEGIPVCRPILSNNDQLIEIIEIKDSCFFAVAFERAKGRHIVCSEWPPILIQKLGQITGKMHKLSKKYKPLNNSIKRMEWFEMENYNVDKYLPDGHNIVKDKLHSLLRKLKTLPKCNNTFGLIHADLRAENISIYNDKLSIYDFDGCMYSWFIHDIAITIFTAVRFNYDIKDKNAFLQNFTEHFVVGYSKENKIFPAWWNFFFDFLKLEEIGEYTLIHRSYDLRKLDTLSKIFMDRRKYSIEKDINYISLNFNSVFFRNKNEFSKCLQ